MATNYKKVYTIRINESVYTKHVWYRRYRSKEFEAELRISEQIGKNYEPLVAFFVSAIHKVNLLDCQVISERTESDTYCINQRVMLKAV